MSVTTAAGTAFLRVHVNTGEAAGDLMGQSVTNFGTPRGTEQSTERHRRLHSFYCIRVRLRLPEAVRDRRGR